MYHFDCLELETLIYSLGLFLWLSVNFKSNMAKRKNQSTLSSSKQSKKAKTALKKKELIEKDIKVTVSMPTSPVSPSKEKVSDNDSSRERPRCPVE